jgi:hypothetical protein
MNLKIFVNLFCRFLGENCICTVQCENRFTRRAHPRNRPFGLIIEKRGCEDWHSDSFPQDLFGMPLLWISNCTTTSGSCCWHDGATCGNLSAMANKIFPEEASMFSLRSMKGFSSCLTYFPCFDNPALGEVRKDEALPRQAMGLIP